MNNLAITYEVQGHHAKAEILRKHFYETELGSLSAEHPDTLIAMSNLASTYCSLGRLEEAKAMLTQELKASSAVLGIEHPHTIASKFLLAQKLEKIRPIR